MLDIETSDAEMLDDEILNKVINGVKMLDDKTLNLIVDSILIERLCNKLYKDLSGCKMYYAIVDVANGGNVTVRELLKKLHKWDALNLLEVLKCM